MSTELRVAEARSEIDSAVLSAVISNPQDRTLMLTTLLHLADLSNVLKPKHVAQKWATLLLQEFFQQGDREKQLHVAVTDKCDRLTTSRALSQYNFVTMFLAPLLAEVVRCFPALVPLLCSLAGNAAGWRDEYAVEMAGQAERGLLRQDELRYKVAKLDARLVAFVEDLALVADSVA